MLNLPKFAAMVLVCLSWTAPAAASTVFSWTGSCPITCANNQATGTLTLNSTFDASTGVINAGNFQSFSLRSGNDFGNTFSNVLSVFGNINTQSLFILGSVGNIFGQSRFGNNGWLFVAPGSGGNQGFGSNGSFVASTGVSPVPLPASGMLIIFGLVACALIGIRRRRNALTPATG